jgi:hypothetical protein
MDTAEQFIEFAQLNRNTKRIKKEMDEAWALLGMPAGAWEVEDLADHLCFKSTGKHLRELTPDTPEPTPEANPPIPEVIPENMSQDVQARYQRYVSQFIPETPNDEAGLWQLCQNEVSLERLNERKNHLIETRAKAGDVKAIIESIRSLSAENRAIQVTLGIDRPSRSTGQDAGDKLMEYVKKAKSVLHRQSVPIFCVNCMRSESRTLNLYGFFVWHLQEEEFRLEFTCPRCGTVLTYTRANIADLKGLAGW